MKLPKPVKIAGHVWKFRRMRRKPHEGADYEPDFGDHGSCQFTNCTIWLSPQVIRQPSQLAETILHEVQHAINENGGVDDESTEEQFTTQSAKGWLMVLRDNPHLIQYIQSLVTAPA